ncbi:MAG: RNA polymerase sigma-54 factor, partial [Desulfovibrio sp.]|nr:RNA polymerase sigma-54 factor [Desulfovibrio sp.]
MALELRQQLKLQQRMVMTPQLRQAIKLLLLSRAELQDQVQQELVDNPFLEESTHDTSQDFDRTNRELERKESHDDDVYDTEVAKEAQWEDYLGEFSSTSRHQNNEFESPEEVTSFETRYASKPSLEAHLLWQLHFSNFSPKEVEIGEEIIGNLSNAGYLEASVAEIAERCVCTENDVIAVLERIQLFDPVGVAARSVQECLYIQLKDLDYDRDPILVKLVINHLEDIEAKRYKVLLKQFHLEMEDLEEYLAIIKELEPMPGASYGDDQPTYISPDIYVYK